MTESNILLVDDEPATIQVMAAALAGLGQLRFASNGAAGLRQARERPTDLILLDAEMPGMSGYQVCEALKQDPALRDVPVIFVTGHGGLEFELRGLALGAADFIAKPISGPLLLARVKTQLQVKSLTDELRRIATIDALTGLQNRRCLDDALEREWKRGLRTGQPVSLLLVDVDHFKRFNDRYGHPAGDACLRLVAGALRGSGLRPSDVVTRYGGEEFALLLPQTPREGARHIAERVLDAVAALKIPHEDSPSATHVTVSVGLGCFDAQTPSWLDAAAGERFALRSAADLLLVADTALYAAKNGGRDQAWQMDVDGIDQPHAVRRTGAIPQVAPERSPA